MRIRSAPAQPAARPAGLLHCLLALAVLVASLVAGPLPAAAAGPLPDGVVWTATVNEHNVERTSSDNPVRLEPGEPTAVVVRLENRSDTAVEIPFVRLEGRVLGLTLYSFTTQVALTLPARETGERSFSIQLLDLGAQASGFIPSRFSLLDGDGHELSGKNLTVDVRGDATSIYWVFGAAIGALTLMLLAGGLWRMATGRLHPNRWRRALVFAAPGLGLGYLVTFTLSGLRVATPDGALWTSLVLGGGVLGFLAGYLSPTPMGSEDLGGGTGGPEEPVPDDEPDPDPEDRTVEPEYEPAWLGGPGHPDDEDDRDVGTRLPMTVTDR
jgi:hypothetical protein